MPFRCSCGFEVENGKQFAGHLGRFSKAGHKKVGWVDPVSGEVFSAKPRDGQRPSREAAAPDVISVSVSQGLGRELPAEKAGSRRVAIDAQTATLIRATPVRLDILYTQQMWTSFECAKLYGYSGALDDWLSLMSLEFWGARGINPFQALGVVFETIPSLTEAGEQLSIGGGDGDEERGPGVLEEDPEAESGAGEGGAGPV